MMALLSPLKKLLDFIIYSNFFIAAGVACFTLQTALFFPAHTSIIEEFSILNFIATFILYNLQRLYYASKENLNHKYNWYIENRRLMFTLMVLLLMCFFTRLLDFFLQHSDYFFIYLFLAALSLFYFLPPLQLRRYGILKPFIISLVFVGTSVILPINKVLNAEVLLYALGQFCFITALCVLFDVKDAMHDQSIHTLTFPIKYGLKNTKWLIIFLCTIYLLCMMTFSSQSLLNAYLIIAGACALLTILVKPNRKAYFYFYLVDGLILLQYFLLQFFLFP